MKKLLSIPIILISLYACSWGNDFNLYKLDISDADSLKITQEITSSRSLSTRNVLMKTISGGEEEYIKYLNSLNLPISFDELTQPLKLVPVNDEFFITGFGHYDEIGALYSITYNYLINTDSGRAYNLYDPDNMNYMLPISDVIENENKLYFISYSYGPSLNISSYSDSSNYYRLDISDPDNITAVNLVPDGYSLSSLNTVVDASGNVFLELSQTPKVVTPELLYLPVDVDNGYFFKRNGSVYVLKEENYSIDPPSSDADFNVKIVNVNNQSVTLVDTVYGFSHDYTGTSINPGNTFSRLIYRAENDSLYLISESWPKDVYKFSFINNSFSKLTSEEFVYYSIERDNIYLITTNEIDTSYLKISKLNLGTEDISEIYSTQGEYSGINFKVNSSGYFEFSSVDELRMQEVIVHIYPDGTVESLNGDSLVAIVDILEL